MTSIRKLQFSMYAKTEALDRKSKSSPGGEAYRDRGKDRCYEDLVLVHPQNKNINNPIAQRPSFSNITKLMDGSVRQRINAMMDDTMKTEEQTLAFDVSDEALEIAAGAAKDKADFTLGACSGLSVCPG